MNKIKPDVRPLTNEEIQALRRDMAESSKWMRAELKRRREVKDKENSKHSDEKSQDSQY